MISDSESNTIVSKKKNTFLTIQKREKLRRDITAQISLSSLLVKYNVSESTVEREKKAIRKCIELPKGIQKSRKKLRKATYEEIETFVENHSQD